MLLTDLAASLVLLFQLDGFSPPQAADHVVRLEIVEGHDASSGDRTVIYRSGSLMRTDWTLYGSTTGSDYADLARGLVVSVARDRGGVVQSVTIGQPIRRPRRLPPTGRQDRLLGESCTIWRLTDERIGSNTEICETADGILLWEAFWDPNSADRTVMYQRATAVERRPVRPEEVLPPRTLLALALEPPSAAAPAAVAPVDYEVELVDDDPERGSHVLRRHGRFSSDARSERGERSFHVGNGAVSVNYAQDEAGRPLWLEIRRGGFNRSDRIASRWERVPGRAPEQLLGETCIWQENVAIQSTDRHYQCLTVDGIPLKTESLFHWTGLQRSTARRLSRRSLRDEDFAPPARVLDWAHWRLTPAP